MRILVSGTGRSGTCWVGGIVMASGQFQFSRYIEDRCFFLHPQLPESYATKLTTENKGFTSTALIDRMNGYPDLNVIWALRHPVDCVLAKIVRGLPKSQNPHGYSMNVTSDTPCSAIMAMLHSHSVYKAVLASFPSRIYSVKLESLIRETDSTVNMLSMFLGCEPNERMYSAHAHTQNKHHQREYGDEIDTSRLDMWKRWETIYDGYFADKSDLVQHVIQQTEIVAIENDYEVATI